MNERTAMAGRQDTPPFRGPLADGPTPAMLDVHAPALETLGHREIRRALEVGASLALRLACSSARPVLRGRPTKARVAQDLAEGMVDAFEQLGPTFVKVGQLMASSPMLVPDSVAIAARRCLDRVTPVPAQIIRRVIEEDLGRPAESIFASFDDVPLSAASVAQVHSCVLRDGRDAVVKVQRPHLRRQMNADLRVLNRIARVAARSRRLRKANPIGMIADLHRVTNEELNFVIEAHRQDRFRAHLHHFGDNEQVTTPEVYWDHCGARVICMERLYGSPIDQFDDTITDVDGFALLRQAVKAWLEAASIHGPFHADLHAGNLWILDDGRIAFLDFGIMGELPPEWRARLRDVLRSTIDHDYARVAAGFKRVGVIRDDAGPDEALVAQFSMVVEPILSQPITSIKLGEVLQMVINAAAQLGDGQVPTEMILIGKQLLYVERYMARLAPTWALGQDAWLLQNIVPPDELEQVSARPD